MKDLVSGKSIDERKSLAEHTLRGYLEANGAVPHEHWAKVQTYVREGKVRSLINFLSKISKEER